MGFRFKTVVFERAFAKYKQKLSKIKQKLSKNKSSRKCSGSTRNRGYDEETGNSSSPHSERGVWKQFCYCKQERWERPACGKSKKIERVPYISTLQNGGNSLSQRFAATKV